MAKRMSLKKAMKRAGVSEVPIVGDGAPVVVDGGKMLPRRVVDKMAPEAVVVPEGGVVVVDQEFGWPVEAEAVVEGKCINPRLVAIKVDGRGCSMWAENRNLRWGQVVAVRLDRASEGNPIYRQVVGADPLGGGVGV